MLRSILNSDNLYEIESAQIWGRNQFKRTPATPTPPTSPIHREMCTSTYRVGIVLSNGGCVQWVLRDGDQHSGSLVAALPCHRQLQDILHTDVQSRSAEKMRAAPQTSPHFTHKALGDLETVLKFFVSFVWVSVAVASGL